MYDQQQQQQVTVTLADISTMVQVIDAVSRRGGFEGQELAGVGMLRNKLVAYVNQNAPQQPEGVGDAEVPVEMPIEGELADKVQ
jgi:butyrate kinase